MHICGFEGVGAPLSESTEPQGFSWAASHFRQRQPAKAQTPLCTDQAQPFSGWLDAPNISISCGGS
jgi:hypothetical protein